MVEDTRDEKDEPLKAKSPRSQAEPLVPAPFFLRLLLKHQTRTESSAAASMQPFLLPPLTPASIYSALHAIRAQLLVTVSFLGRPSQSATSWRALHRRNASPPGSGGRKSEVKVSAEPPVLRVLLCFFQLLAVAGNPRGPRACSHITPTGFCPHVVASLCVCSVSLCPNIPLLVRTPIVGFGPNLIQCITSFYLSYTCRDPISK